MVDINQVALLFRSASNQNLDEIRLVEQQLAQLNRTHGFFIAATKILINRDYEFSIRIQAALYLKNSIDAIWRKSRAADQFAISDEEKSLIRSELLSRFDEENDQMNIQIAVIIGKLARLDCPQNWPELIPALSDAIFYLGGGDSLSHNRALFILYYVVKALVSKRLAPDKRLFHELSLRVFNSLSSLWRAHFEHVSTSFAHASSCLLCLKILRYVVNYGFANHYDVFDVRVLLSDLPGATKRVLELALTGNDQILNEKQMKIAQLSLKMILEFQNLHTLDFVHLLNAWLEFCSFAAFDDQMLDINLPTLKLRAINFLKIVLLCEDYRTISDQKTTEICQKAADIRQAFFNGEKVRTMCYLLIRKYLRLTDDSLNRWHTEPELFATADDSHSWNEYLPAAAESFYVALVHECWSDLRQVVPQWLCSINQHLDYNNLNEVLNRDALLSALGLAANDLYEEIDFDNLFKTIFYEQLLTPILSNGHNIIRRRILWVCGKWVGVKFSKPLRAQLYHALVENISNADNDAVVRLTACQSLKSAIDDFEFDLDTFRSFIDASVTALIQLLKNCHESDAQIVICAALWLLAEQVGAEIRNSIETILVCTPTLWETDNNMLKCHILTLFTQLVKVLKADCLKIVDGLCSILPTALDHTTESHVYLFEDGLDLWLALLENLPTPLPKPLFDLFRFLPSLISSQTENLKLCCEIVKAYCVCSMPEFLETWLPVYAESVSKVLLELRHEGQVALLKTVETAIKCFKNSALNAVGGILRWCVSIITVDQQVTTPVLVVACAIIAHASMYGVTQFLQCLMPYKNEDIKFFLQRWLQKFALTTHDLERRKLFALGFCAWLIYANESVDDLFPDIFYVIVEVLADVCTKEDGAFVDNLVAYDFGGSLLEATTGFAQEPFENEHDKRMLKLRESDPVYSTPLQTTVVNCFNCYKQNRGETKFAELIARVDKEVLTEFRNIIPNC